MPIFSIQIELQILTGMLGDEIFVQNDSQTGARRERKVPVDYVGITRSAGQHVILAKIVEVFLDLEVRYSSGQVHGRGGRNRPAHIVWCYRDVVRLRPRRDLP